MGRIKKPPAWQQPITRFFVERKEITHEAVIKSEPKKSNPNNEASYETNLEDVSVDDPAKPPLSTNNVTIESVSHQCDTVQKQKLIKPTLRLFKKRRKVRGVFEGVDNSVEKILDRRRRRGGVEYQVRWKEDDLATWELEDDLGDARVKLAWFDQKQRFKKKRTVVVKQKGTIMGEFASCVTPLIRNVFKDVLEEQNKINTDDSIENKKVIAKNANPKEVPKTIAWKDKGVRDGSHTYHSGVSLPGGLVLALGDSVITREGRLATVVNLSEGPDGPTVHVHWFCRGTDTVVGEAADPAQLFQTDECGDLALDQVSRRCRVENCPKLEQEEWREQGGSQPEKNQEFLPEFRVAQWHDMATRFEIVRKLPECPEDREVVSFCGVCVMVAAREERERPVLGEMGEAGCYTSLTWRGDILKPGDAVFLRAGACRLGFRQEAVKMGKEVKMDEEIYTEYYRKRNNKKCEAVKNPDPFQVAIIKRIEKDSWEVSLRVQLLYRPGKFCFHQIPLFFPQRTPTWELAQQRTPSATWCTGARRKALCLLTRSEVSATCGTSVQPQRRPGC